jgi:hypothetical protein
MIPRLHFALTRLALLGLLCCGSAAALAEDPNADIYGKWKIKAVIGMGAETSMNDRQIQRIIGKPLLISADKIEFNGRTCHPHYQRSREETTQHFDWAWRTDVSKIPFPNPVTIIDTGGCDYLYPIRKDHLMIAEENVFFEAVRIGRPLNKATSTSRR